MIKTIYKVNYKIIIIFHKKLKNIINEINKYK